MASQEIIDGRTVKKLSHTAQEVDDTIDFTDGLSEVSGVVKMQAGVPSGAVAGTDYATPAQVNTKQDAILSETGTLTTTWTNNEQTISVTGVTTNNRVVVSPAPLSAAAYAEAGIICTSQALGTLTFTCETEPTNALTVNVLIL